MTPDADKDRPEYQEITWESLQQLYEAFSEFKAAILRAAAIGDA